MTPPPFLIMLLYYLIGRLMLNTERNTLTGRSCMEYLLIGI